MQEHVAFNYISTKAANLEKMQNFEEAEHVWILASTLANKLWNKEWCLNRAHHCAKKISS